MCVYIRTGGGNVVCFCESAGLVIARGPPSPTESEHR